MGIWKLYRTSEMALSFFFKVPCNESPKNTKKKLLNVPETSIQLIYICHKPSIYPCSSIKTNIKKLSMCNVKLIQKRFYSPESIIFMHLKRENLLFWLNSQVLSSRIFFRLVELLPISKKRKSNTYDFSKFYLFVTVERYFFLT